MKLKRRRPSLHQARAEELRREYLNATTAPSEYAAGLDFVTFMRLANRLATVAVPATSSLAPLFTHAEIDRRIALQTELENVLNEVRRIYRREHTPAPSLTSTLAAAAVRRRAIQSAGNVLEFKARGK